MATNQSALIRFRWVKLQLDLFHRIELSNDFDQKLLKLEQTTMELKDNDRAKLYAAYDEMFDLNVGNNPRDIRAVQKTRESIVHQILWWTLCTFRPLRLSDLLEAIRVNDSNLAEGEIDEEYILEKGSNFVRQDVRHRVVFTHLSVREYLLDLINTRSSNRFSLTYEQIHSRAAIRCLQHLSLRDPTLDDWEILRRNTGRKQDFYTYSCTYWPQHLSSVSEVTSPPRIGHVLSVFREGLQRNNQWRRVADFMDLLVETIISRKQTDGIMSRAFDALAEVNAVLQMLSDQDNWVGLAIVQCLLAGVINLDADNRIMETAITNNDALLEMLLYYDIPIDRACTREESNIHLAATSGSSEGMRMLLEASSLAQNVIVTLNQSRLPIELALLEHNFGVADILWSVMMESLEGRIPADIADHYMTSLSFGRVTPRSDKRHYGVGSHWDCCNRIKRAVCKHCENVLRERIPRHRDGQYSMGTIYEICRRARKGCNLCQFFYSQCCQDMELQTMPLLGNRDALVSFQRMLTSAISSLQSGTTNMIFLIQASILLF